jgi:hypothetical protein
MSDRLVGFKRLDYGTYQAFQIRAADRDRHRRTGHDGI